MRLCTHRSDPFINELKNDDINMLNVSLKSSDGLLLSRFPGGICHLSSHLLLLLFLPLIGQFLLHLRIKGLRTRLDMTLKHVSKLFFERKSQKS